MRSSPIKVKMPVTEAENTKDHSEEWSHVPIFKGLNGGADGTRTRALRRICAFFAQFLSHLQPPKSAAPHLWEFCGDCYPRWIQLPHASARR